MNYNTKDISIPYLLVENVPDVVDLLDLLSDRGRLFWFLPLDSIGLLVKGVELGLDNSEVPLHHRESEIREK